MSTYNPRTQTPTGINTLERTIAHALLALKSINQVSQIQVIPNTAPERQILANIFQADDGKVYLFGQVYIPIDGDWESANVPVWENALEINNAAIPTRYLGT